MHGLMQDWPLLANRIIDHAAQYHGDREVVSRTVEGPIHRTTYAQINSRARQLASALAAHGCAQGDVVGTLAWNTHRHIEIWYGVMGLGAVCHTINPRLFAEQIIYIVNHGEDHILFVDLTFLPLVEKIADQLPLVKTYVVMTDGEHMPETSLAQLEGVEVFDYESFISAGDPAFAWAQVDEETACGLCYTSGTTGNPKGVLYSHRSTVLHALACNGADLFGLRSVDTVMPVVPMFHANAWSIIFVAPMAGAKLVLPGAGLDGEALYEMLESEQVTCTAAVPTLWLMLLQHLEKTGAKPSSLKRVFIGGAACPETIIDAFEDRYGVEVIHAWGMTEMSPIGSACVMTAAHANLDAAALRKIKLTQGRPPFTVELKIVDDDGVELARDGQAIGNLLARGPAVSRRYHKGEGGEIVDADNWFSTGDVATLDHQGFITITDRSKDVIKSGGEWISTIEIENIAVGHPEVAEAAVIGVSHPKWSERPLLIVVRVDKSDVGASDILAYLDGKIARWWMPDDVVFVQEIPHTATGKIQKRVLREQFADYRLPTG
ncbi:MAG: long-chain-fatty-acid--CoA ligase [Alphaproteobacteria bacterium]